MSSDSINDKNISIEELEKITLEFKKEEQKILR